MTTEFAPISSWGITSENILTVLFKDGDTFTFDLETWTRTDQPRTILPMTPKEVEFVCGLILFKCNWPFREGVVLVTNKTNGELVSVTLNESKDLFDGGPELEVLWRAPKPAPALDKTNLAVPVTSLGKPHPSQIMFSVNTYDADGDFAEKGVFLHFGNTKVCVAEDPNDFVALMPRAMQRIADELAENYNLDTGRPK